MNNVDNNILDITCCNYKYLLLQRVFPKYDAKLKDDVSSISCLRLAAAVCTYNLKLHFDS